MIADLLFLQEPAPVDRKKPGPVEVQAGPFAKSVASSMQKCIVPWCIARFGLSFPKEFLLESVQEMLIAIIDAEQLMPGYPDCAAEAKKYSVASKDFALRVKAAAGMYLVVLCLYFRCAYQWSYSLPPPLQYGPRAGTVSRCGMPYRTLRGTRSR
jgi:hypothetical protein